jgi:lysozyme
MRRALLATLAFLLLCAAALLLVPALRDRWRPWGPAWVQGIDVSHHQGEIDWSAVAEDGVRFAWIKATEGGDWVDPRFEENQRGAAEAGIPWGAYHFFTFCRPGAEQAANFLAKVPPRLGELPPAVDLEYGGNCDARPDTASLGVELEAFMQAVESATGRRPMIYATGELIRDHIALLVGEELWIRAIHHPLGMESPVPAAVWQYSNIGRVAGIQGRVDRNACRVGGCPW